MRAVSNSGPIIHLSWIDQLHLLTTLFDEVIVPSSVRDEVLAVPEETLGLNLIRRAFMAGDLQVRETSPVEGARRVGLELLQNGESDAILLAEDCNADFVLLDDRAARNAAERRALRLKGTAGILLDASAAGLIPAAVPFVEELRRHGQWISDELVRVVAEVEGRPS